MYKKIPRGKCITVQGLDCWLPPVGWGTHCDTGDMERVDIIKRSKKESEQYWEPQKLPDDYLDKLIKESEKQNSDKEYTDPDLDSIREREWQRRLYGVWLYVNGEPIYITGWYYFFLNYWHLDTGLPDYRLVDLEYSYFWQHCVEDPNCYGMIETRKRRDGKTKRAGCTLYEFASRTPAAWSGIQSMNRDVAGELFSDDIVVPFKLLPDFFVPVYDQSQSDTPKSSLRFFRTAVKGRRATKNMRGVELKSKIDFKDAKPKAYDGKKVHRLLLDESGKIDTDVIKRHIILKPCLVDNKRRIVGKMVVTSTVEEMGLEFRYKELWVQSDQYKREPDGTSKSGLYRFFIPADRAGNYDMYGTPLQEAELKSILNERSKTTIQSDLIDLIRKFPLSENEAFKTADNTCLYNWEYLNDQADFLSWRDNLTERGNFVWKNGDRFGEVEWKKDKGGRWEICYLFEKHEDSNSVLGKYSEEDFKSDTLKERTFIPNNNYRFAIGCDPFKYDKVADNRRSDCAAFVYKKQGLEKHEYDNFFVCKYKHRAPTRSMQYEDILKMSWYYGCQVLFERNVDNWIDWFKENKATGFLMKLPGEEEYGLYADGHGNTTQILCDHTEAHINEHIKKVYYADLVDEWLKFRVDKTTQFDCAMAAGYTLIAAKNKRFKKQETLSNNDVSNYFRKYKLNAV